MIPILTRVTFFLGVGLAAFVAGAALLECGTRLTGVDTTAVKLEAQDCQDIAGRLADAGPGFSVERAESRACLCGARGILRRAGESVSDASAGCPQ